MWGTEAPPPAPPPPRALDIIGQRYIKFDIVKGFIQDRPIYFKTAHVYLSIV